MTQKLRLPYYLDAKTIGVVKSVLNALAAFPFTTLSTLSLPRCFRRGPTRVRLYQTEASFSDSWICCLSTDICPKCCSASTNPLTSSPQLFPRPFLFCSGIEWLRPIFVLFYFVGFRYLLMLRKMFLRFPLVYIHWCRMEQNDWCLLKCVNTQ